MTRRTKVGLALLGSALALAVIAWIGVHSASVQDRVWHEVCRRVESATGVVVAADDVHARVWPAGLRLRGLSLRSASGTFVTVDAVEVRWSWRELLASPPHIRRIALDEVRVDLDHLPSTPRGEGDGGGVDALWQSVDIDELRITAAGLGGDLGPVGVSASGLTVRGALVDGTLDTSAVAERVVVDRDGRSLAVGPVEVGFGGSREQGLQVRRVAVSGDAVAGSARASVDLQPLVVRVPEFALEVDLARVVAWWDPALQDRVATAGRLQLEGDLSWAATTGLELRSRHVGPPVEVFGFGFERLAVDVRDEAAVVEVEGPWGQAQGSGWTGRAVRLDARLRDPDLRPALARAAVDVPAAVRGPIRARGTVGLSLEPPYGPRSVAGNVDLDVRTADAVAVVRGTGGDGAWDLDTVRLRIADARIEGSGRVSLDGFVDVDVTADVPDPAASVEALDRWLPDAVDRLAPAGGPATGRVTVRGPVAAPDVAASLSWTDPELAGIALRSVRFDAAGDRGRIEWTLAAAAGTGAGEVVLEGVTTVADLATTGQWSADTDDIGRLVRSVGPGAWVPDDLAGRIEGRGTWSLRERRWAAGGTVRASGVTARGWEVDSVIAAFDVDPELLRVPDLEVTGYGGRLSGSVEVPLDPRSGIGVDVGLVLEGFETGALPTEVPWWGVGTVWCTVELAGPSSEPEGVARVAWLAEDADAPMRSGAVDLAVAGGRLTAIGDGLESAGGPVALRVDLPLGDVPRPDWLWSSAPAGSARADVFAEGLDVAPFVAAFLGTDPAWALQTDAELAVRWDLGNPAARVAELRLDDLVLDTAIEELRSEGPIVVEVDGSQALVRSASLRSERSDIRVDGRVALDTGALDLAGELELSPELVRLLPLPVRARGAVRAVVDVGGTLSAPTGRLELDHRGGAIVMRDPPVELLDTRLVAVLDEGAIWIEEGSASLNRGRVELGGGWDPASGQGIVAQLEDVVMVLPMSILTRWRGEIALEPANDPNRVATVVGELVLESGLWDRPFDYTGVLLGPADPGTAGDDPLYQVGLNLRVRGREGVHVENNLGVFDVAWDTLRIGGTAAEPQIVGQMRLEPGGRIELPGRTVTIRRGTVQFTGNAETDPLLEIVPVEDVARFAAGEDSGSIDVGTLATQGLASSVGTALGFENRTLTPEEIAVETETDTATQFSIGQRLSRNLALFFSTDLTDPQSGKTQLQLWNLSWAPGLALQVYDDTGDDETGANVIQRFRWGGTVGVSDTPVIQKIRLEGEWPISKRRARRSTGLAKGQPYDPFMLFVAGLRLERALAEAGYQLARVDGTTEGPDRLPALVFRCEPGPRQTVVFEGDRLPRRVRREVMALYQPPPLERSSLDAMEALLQQHARSEGHIEAEVEVERRGEAIVATSVFGPRTTLSGPVVDGVPDDVAASVRRVLGTPAELDRSLDDPERAERILRRLLYAAGYHEASLQRVWLEPMEDDRATVHLEVAPGPRATLDEIAIEGPDPLGLASGTATGLVVGMPFDRGAVDRVLSDIRSTYVENGWRAAEVHARTTELAPGAWKLGVVLEPGTQRTVREIDVNGERHVREKFLRHGFEVETGEVLIPSQLDQSVVQAATFPPVERIEVRTTPVGPDQVDVEFGVTEKPRWTVELGGGWGSERGAVVRYGVRDDNLFGRGFSLNLRGQWQQDENLVLLYAILPPLPGDRLTLSSTLRWFDGDLRSNPDNFYQQRLSLSLEANYRLGSEDMLRTYVERARTEQTFKDRDNPFAPLLDSVDNESILGVQFVRDRLDNPFDPRSGYGLAVDLSGNLPELGSDLADIRVLGRGNVAWQPIDRWTWIQAVRLGWAEGRQGDELVPDRRFYAGGQASIRGFDRDSVGPVQPAIGGFAPAGGGALAILNEELRMRVWRQVSVAVFVDAGQVWRTWSEADLDLAVGAGLGVRISTPIGPLWADVAWPVANLGVLTSDGPKYYVGIGRPF